ncbi:MAG: glycosyltransferase family 2 protein [Gammaproteobacteria bacterium]|nr:glycosyltransferase family 2 protein [Gammaproteobacteria bacterium]
MSKPFFSIVIPTYNRASSIAHTLEGCFKQTFEDFEVIVVDDGSSDNTVDVLSEIKDPRLVVIEQQNAGPAAARNSGAKAAQGRYVAYLDSDDVWYPEFLQDAHVELKKTPDVFLYGQIIIDRGVGRYWIKPERALGADESLFDFLYVEGGFIQTSTMIVPKTLCEKVQWNESITFGDNDQYAIDCWRTGIPFRMMPRALTLYADVMTSDALSQLPIFDANSEKYTNFFGWMTQQQPFMSDKAWLGFRARFESVNLARSKPLSSMGLVFKAYRGNTMGLGGAARQLLQNFAPRLYRKLTNTYVKYKGVSLQSIDH